MKWKYITTVFIFTIIFCLLPFHSVSSCKNIIACGNTTKGDYNLLLKVRDPSRPGFQVLTIVPKGYTYKYHHPWTGETTAFTVNHSFIGVATLGDTIPDIVKTGMCFTTAGLAFGDADTNTNWKNPSPNAWDDFDWIRYACQTAENEDEAIDLLTKQAVDLLHASCVPENLFVVGPNKGVVIEADMVHYDVNKINDNVVVMSNYAKNLWRKSLFLRLIAPSFDATFQGEVSKGEIIRLGEGSIYGIKITNINADHIQVKQIPIQFKKGNIIGRTFDFFSTTMIQSGQAETMGFYRIDVHEITNEKASISMCFEYYAWEEKMKKIMQPSRGNISVSTMMDWSRVHEADIDGLRGMCDDHDLYPFEGCMIYKIPTKNFDLISEGWFSPNHPCVSIYVPVHICNIDIYEAYTTSKAANLSFHLFEIYGHDVLTDSFNEIEQVFIEELVNIKPVIMENINDSSNLSSLLTTVDVNMQKQAFLTQQLWMNISRIENTGEIISFLSSMWKTNYSTSLKNMETFFTYTQSIKHGNILRDDIIDIVVSISEMRLGTYRFMHINNDSIENDFQKVKTHLYNRQYSEGFSLLYAIFSETDQALYSMKYNTLTENGEEQPFTTYPLEIISLSLLFGLLLISYKKKIASYLK